MKINVGDYVRYKYENCIYMGKIKFISEVMGFEETLQLDIDTCMEEILKEDVIKSSPNIIDLIEVGDYVNGRKVSKINLDMTFNKEKSILCGDFDYDCLETIYTNEDIKSIVTKEMYASVEYRVETN